jgi:hypothetical protein
VNCERCGEREIKHSLAHEDDGDYDIIHICHVCYEKLLQLLKGHDVVDHPDDRLPDFEHKNTGDSGD